MKTNPSNVPIAELPSLSVPRNKNCLRPEVILTTLNAVPHAVKQGKHSATAMVPAAMEMMATAADAKCFPWYALNVEKILKYLSNPAETDLCIAAIATIKSNLSNRARLSLKKHVFCKRFRRGPVCLLDCT